MSVTKSLANSIEVLLQHQPKDFGKKRKKLVLGDDGLHRIGVKAIYLLLLNNRKGGEELLKEKNILVEKCSS